MSGELKEKQVRGAGMVCAMAAACVLSAMPAMAQNLSSADDGRTGVSHPPTAPIVADGDPDAPVNAPAVVSKPQKPSAAIPMTAPTGGAATPAGSVIPASKDQVYGAYVPYNGGSGAAAANNAGPAFDPDANIVTADSAARYGRRELSNTPAGNDPDGRIVTAVMAPPGAVAEGTLVRARLNETLSTETTLMGTRFTATVSEPVLREGQVIVPAGAVLNGRVTYVHSGTKFNGGAAIHLEPLMITLPDGSEYDLRARVIDTGSWDKTKVDDEGTIEHRNTPGKTAAAIGLAAGGGAAAGAMMGGPPGALIGAGVGAGAATVVWLKQDRQAELPRNLELVFSMTEPMSSTPMGVPNKAAAVGIERNGSGGGE